MFAIGNAPLIPSLATRWRVSTSFTSTTRSSSARSSPCWDASPGVARRQALLVHYKNRLVGKGPRGAAFEAYEHIVAPALIAAADRVCVLSQDHADSVTYLRRTGERRPEKLVEMPNGVDAEQFSPEGGRCWPARTARDRARRAGRRLRRHPRPRPPLQARRPRHRRPGRARQRARPPARRRRRRAARGLSPARPRQRSRRARPLPRRGPSPRAGEGAARRRRLPADHRAAGVVRDRPDRGDGLRPARSRDRLPRRARGGRRRGKRAGGAARRSVGGGRGDRRADRGRP